MSTNTQPVDLSNATVFSLLSGFVSSDNAFWQTTSLFVIMGVITSGIMYSKHKTNKLVKSDMIFYTVITPFVLLMAGVALKGKGNNTVHMISNISKFILFFLFGIMFVTNLLKTENFANLNRDDKDKKNRN